MSEFFRHVDFDIAYPKRVSEGIKGTFVPCYFDCATNDFFNSARCSLEGLDHLQIQYSRNCAYNTYMTVSLFSVFQWMFPAARPKYTSVKREPSSPLEKNLLSLVIAEIAMDVKFHPIGASTIQLSSIFSFVTCILPFRNCGSILLSLCSVFMSLKYIIQLLFENHNFLSVFDYGCKQQQKNHHYDQNCCYYFISTDPFFIKKPLFVVSEYYTVSPKGSQGNGFFPIFSCFPLSVRNFKRKR